MAEVDDAAFGPDALVADAKAAQDDPAAEVLRANVRAHLFGAPRVPLTLGRFTVLETIGSGAMGTVFAAYDPVLDRKVAIKLLRQTGERGRREVLREARALAKLSHPNVVTIHEADVVAQRVYIAMEFVQGVALHVWLAERPRAWSQVVATLLPAARGLCAAHAAGLTHSDFKPHNVLVGEHGVRVADFGMAQPLTPATSPTADRQATGGTPPYMAPERLAGAPASAKSDQFAFAVTLWEALFGARPFPGPTVAELRAQMHTLPRVPAHGAAVPAWLCALVRRGLAENPDDRHASMDDVVAALGRPRTRGIRLAAAAGVGTLLLATGGLAYRSGTARDPCDGGIPAARTAWDPARAQQMTAAFVATGASFAASTAQRVDEALTDYREQWQAQYREVCEATRVRGSQSDSMYDQRMRCLDRRRDALAALGDALTTVRSASAAAQAVSATAELVPLSRCAAAVVAQADVAEPEDPATRDAVATVRRGADQAWAQYHVGHYPEALRLAQDLMVRAEQIGYAPQRAQIRALLGTTQARQGGLAQAEATLRQALLEAAAVGNDRLAAEVTLRLLRTILFNGDAGRVRELADFARAASVRAGDSRHEVEGIVGEALLNEGDPDGATAALTDALRSEARPDHIAILHVNLGSAALARGDVDAAARHYQEGLRIAVDHFGPDHPAVGFYLQRLGRGQRAAGDLAQAQRTLQDALRLREQALGAEDRAVGSTLLDLARVELDLGAWTEASAHGRRALEIRRAEYGAEHPRLAEPLLLLGDAAVRAGDPVDAVARYERARALRGKATPQHPELAAIEAGLSRAYRAMGDAAAAAAALERARAAAAPLPADHPSQAVVEQAVIEQAATAPPEP